MSDFTCDISKVTSGLFVRGDKGLPLRRSNDSLASLKNLLDEATFYDKQWAANWQNQTRPKEQD